MKIYNYSLIFLLITFNNTYSGGIYDPASRGGTKKAQQEARARAIAAATANPNAPLSEEKRKELLANQINSLLKDLEADIKLNLNELSSYLPSDKVINMAKINDTFLYIFSNSPEFQGYYIINSSILNNVFEWQIQLYSKVIQIYELSNYILKNIKRLYKKATTIDSLERILTKIAGLLNLLKSQEIVAILQNGRGLNLAINALQSQLVNFTPKERTLSGSAFNPATHLKSAWDSIGEKPEGVVRQEIEQANFQKITAFFNNPVPFNPVDINKLNATLEQAKTLLTESFTKWS